VLSEPLLLGLASRLELVKSIRLLLGRTPQLVLPCNKEIGHRPVFTSQPTPRAKRTFRRIRNAVLLRSNQLGQVLRVEALLHLLLALREDLLALHLRQVVQPGSIPDSSGFRETCAIFCGGEPLTISLILVLALDRVRVVRILDVTLRFRTLACAGAIPNGIHDQRPGLPRWYGECPYSVFRFFVAFPPSPLGRFLRLPSVAPDFSSLGLPFVAASHSISSIASMSDILVYPDVAARGEGCDQNGWQGSRRKQSLLAVLLE
jgi:hypothetical protein